MGRFLKPQLEKIAGVKFQAGSSDPCEQSKNIERFRENELSGQIFQPVEN